ncbi:hypothetical protein RIF29_06715 [Crotalaria pallida]|uniref:Uncharacterized protein n=1 Tax=Crotalaria pallida TaxID=3830 RepID=A0AAN9PBG2_CROPI
MQMGWAMSKWVGDRVNLTRIWSWQVGEENKRRRRSLIPDRNGTTVLVKATDLGGAGINDGGLDGGEGDLRQRRFARDFSVAILTVKTGNKRSIVEITGGTVCVRDHEKTVRSLLLHCLLRFNIDFTDTVIFIATF